MGCALALAGAARAQVAPAPQQPPPPPGVLPVPPDTVPPAPNDSAAKKDSLLKKDTVMTPFAQAEMPPVLEPGQSYTFDRDALFNTGALTLNQLLQRVLGITTYQSGWIPSVQYASFLGNPGKIRIFIDGVELQTIGNSTSSPIDLASVAIWNVQDLTVERGTDEARIYIRTWSVTHTHTQSRVDIVTGDLGTNMLRAYFGARWRNGMGLQFGGQVYGTQTDLTVGSGSANDLMIRFGWARGDWSVDAYAQRGNGTRDPQAATFQQDTALARAIPGQNGSRALGYLRAAYGRADSSRTWAQVMLTQQQVEQQNLGSALIPYYPPDSSRVRQSATQLIAIHFSLSDRYRWLPAGGGNEATGRLDFATKPFTLTAFVDAKADSGALGEAAITLTPMPWLMVQGAAGYRKADSAAGGDGASGRLLLGAQLGRVWLSGGVVRRASTMVPGLVGYDAAYVNAPSAEQTGLFFSGRGKVVDDVGVDFWVVRWQKPGWYLPQLQERGEVYLETQWLKKFPSGNFGLHASFGEEYRSDVMFPTAGAPEAFSANTVVAIHSVVLYTNIEVRIQTATLYFTSNWALTPVPYEWIPQYLQPIQFYTYGLRWAFWN